MSDASRGSVDGRSDSASASSVTPDEAFRALSDPQRRAVLSYLRERPDETVAVETVVETVVSRSADESSRRHVAVSLSQNHLPKLADWNLIEYDSECRRVRYNDSPLVNGLLARLDSD